MHTVLGKQTWGKPNSCCVICTVTLSEISISAWKKGSKFSFISLKTDQSRFVCRKSCMYCSVVRASISRVRSFVPENSLIMLHSAKTNLNISLLAFPAKQFCFRLSKKHLGKSQKWLLYKAMVLISHKQNSRHTQEHSSSALSINWLKLMMCIVRSTHHYELIKLQDCWAAVL